jgi:serine protein kinase
MAALWAVLTRLEEPKKHNLSVLQKAEALQRQARCPGFTEDNVKELRKEPRKARGHGRHLAALRAGQDLERPRLATPTAKCINPFMVINELESGLRNHSLITTDDERSATASCSAS